MPTLRDDGRFAEPQQDIGQARRPVPGQQIAKTAIEQFTPASGQEASLPAQVSIASADTEESLYVCPANTHLTVRIIVIDRSGTSQTYRIAHVPGGGSAGNANYLAYDTALGANETDVIEGIELNATDELRCEASSTSVTVQVQGAP